jgi:UDP-N-acetylglucosamine 2-epimerase (non-hydrolysing)/GDP/UDP-N,N'-diacetylbacillosamine 2-epimerase (hydrolysing)
MSEKRKIAVITTSRADYGIYKPILSQLSLSEKLDYYLLVSGTHLSKVHGLTISQIKKDNHPIVAEIEIIEANNDALSTDIIMANAIKGFGEEFSKNKPDILLVLGDRFEMLAATLAAVPFNIPIAHIHGGEVSEGAIDDVYRHALTKISHIHFCSTKLSKQRIVQMGENPEFVFDFGAPSLDNLNDVEIISDKDLRSEFNIPKNKDFVLVTYHPVTKEAEDTESHINNLLSAVSKTDLFLVFTLANADVNGEVINNKIKEFVSSNHDSIIADNLGTQKYFSMMSHASVVIGNSSSGIIEAASFKTAVVNIGNRQKGREQSDNIINCGYSVEEIKDAINYSKSDDFRDNLKSIVNIYGNSTASRNIVKILEECDIEKAFNKSFHLL